MFTLFGLKLWPTIVSITKKFISEFLELYKSHPTLWDLSSPDYNDRDKKRYAYIEMVEKLRELEPECTKEDVVRKINSLRSAFRREYRKVKQMKACGKTHKPSLWYYDLLSFTINTKSEGNTVFELVQNLKNETVTDIIDDRTDSRSETSPDTLNMISFKEEEDPFMEDLDDLETDDVNVMNREDPVRNNNGFKVSDEFDAVGFNVASKLRNMDKNQKIIAERIIAETLFQGQMGTLTVNTSPNDFVPIVPLNTKSS
ncbi:hypothetical protein NQ315_000744 [Exocentrus adspersus]|uniref:MADF domain-containing protein n=1 Tax=Exocentrus adspersus TaxID=1586481 RepID=A0AAV8WDA7_9CUCU|nr:hypothetical protein NQ315_000744 [Exocentrus adspersus]